MKSRTPGLCALLSMRVEEFGVLLIMLVGRSSSAVEYYCSICSVAAKGQEREKGGDLFMGWDGMGWDGIGILEELVGQTCINMLEEAKRRREKEKGCWLSEERQTCSSSSGGAERVIVPLSSYRIVSYRTSLSYPTLPYPTPPIPCRTLPYCIRTLSYLTVCIISYAGDQSQ